MPSLVVVGAGIVGLSCAWSAQRLGWHVTVLDRNPEGDRASHGNAGGIAVSECIPLSLDGMGLKPLRWLFDPLGPLSIRPTHAARLLPWFLALMRVGGGDDFVRIASAMAALNARALSDVGSLLDDIGLGSELNRRGALTVYETEAGYLRERGEWQLRRSLGVRWRDISIPELRELEPGLAPVFARAVMIDDWAHVDDPQRIVSRLRERLRIRGAEIVSGEARNISLEVENLPTIVCADGRHLAADKLVIAAGAWSKRLAGSIADHVLLESERGYNTTLPASTNRLSREVIFAERKFVATPLVIGLRIGGAAEFAGLDAPPNFRRSDALLMLARRYFRDLDDVGSRRWMGHRPATPDSLPVIGSSPRNDRVIYAFGHGHLGLTQAATTGVIVGDLISGAKPRLDLSPYSISRF